MKTQPPSKPFRITLAEDLAILDEFAEIGAHNVDDLEWAFPVVSQAVAELFEQGVARFIFDLRTARLEHAWPIAKYGAIYGVLRELKKRRPDALAEWPRRVKLVGEPLHEIAAFRLEQFLECCATVEAARQALGPPPA
jgi:hypothetical protein